MVRLGPRLENFFWASGIEDTFVPQTRRGHRALDEYELMGHYDNWREDILLAKEVGVNSIRWGIPWYKVEPKEGEWDWSWIDEVLPFIVEECGITLIADLMHYGTPFWLEREFLHPDYPKYVSRYAKEFAKRYGSLVKYYTPLNEPLVNALWAGKRGLWPPYLKGDRGYIKLMLQIARGMIATVEEIKSVDPNAIMVQVEATGLTRADRLELNALAIEDQHRGYLCFDLLTGRVHKSHPLFPWLLRNGATIDELREFTHRAIKLDVLGLNFYPQWSTQQLYTDPKGRLAYRATEQDGSGFATMIEDYYRRYNAPVIVTETSAFGSDDLRLQWLHSSLDAIKRLRENGIPVYGYTWFPMMTMIDWRYRTSSAPMEHFYVELGMYRLKRGDDQGDPIRDANSRWIRTPLVEEFRRMKAAAEKSIGICSYSTPFDIPHPHVG